MKIWTSFRTVVALSALHGLAWGQTALQLMQQATPSIQANVMAGKINVALDQLDALHKRVSRIAGHNSAEALELRVAIGDLYRGTGKLAKAEQIYESAKDLIVASGGSGTFNDAYVTMRLAALRLAQGKTDQADRAVRDALKVMDRIGIQPTNQNYTNALDTLCSVYEATGRYNDYVNTTSKILDLVRQREQGGSDHINALMRHARGLILQTRLVEAASELKQALEFSQRLNSALQMTACAALLAKCTALSGEFAEGERMTRQVIDVLSHADGMDQSIAEMQQMLGYLCLGTGKFDAAEAAAKKSIELGDNLPGAPVRRAHSLTILANVEASRGNINATRKFVNDAMASATTAFGEEHPEFAAFIYDLAELMGGLQDNALALPLAQRALSLRLKTLNADNALIAFSKLQIAGFWIALEDYDKALPLLDESGPVLKATVGPLHGKTLSCELMRGKAYAGRNRKGDAARALQISRKLLEIMPSTQSPVDIETLLKLSTISALHSGDPAGALVSAKRLWKSISNRTTKDQAEGDSANRFYISALIRLGKTAEARERFLSWSHALSQTLNKVGGALNARQWSQVQRVDGVFAPPVAIEDGPLLFDTIQKFKGLFMDMIEHEHRLVLLAASKPETRQLAQRAQSLSAGLRRSWMKAEGNAAHLTDLTTELEKTTQELLQRVDAAPFKRETWTAEEIANRLPANGALIDIVRVTLELESEQVEVRYAAAVLRPGKAVQFVRLGAADNIDQAATAYLKLLEDKDHLFAKDLDEKNRTLFTLALKPLLDACGDASEIFLVPDGTYHHMPLAALRDERDAFVCESRFIRLLNQSSDLMRSQAVASEGRHAAIFGAVDYDHAHPGADSAPDRLVMRGDTIHADSDTGLTDVELRPLSSSISEVKKVAGLFDAAGIVTETFTGPDATESAIRRLQSPDFLHVVTHCYTLDRLPGRSRKAGLTALLPAHEPDAMMLSGLVLAGAKKTFNAWRDGTPPPSFNDGVLLAGEAADLDLKNTRLVTLSACTTGRGETRNGIGMYGLKQGFFDSGAQNVMVTLWPIADAPETVEVIASFYQRLLAGKSAAEALNDVQRDLLPKWRAKDGTVVATFLAAPFVLTSRLAQ
jgi:CHAT domain-containing protein